MVFNIKNLLLVGLYLLITVMFIAAIYLLVTVAVITTKELKKRYSDADEDCRRCWCNRCENLAICEKHRSGACGDGIRPLPCVDCTTGKRFKPIEKKACSNFSERKKQS